MDVKVFETQLWINETYGHVINFPTVIEDGITGHSTFRALIWALQIEIAVPNPDGIFGYETLSRCPILIQSSNPYEETPSNLIYILQGSLWCKGISPGGFTGVFGPGTASAIIKFQIDAGIEGDMIVRPYILQGIMNTDRYDFTPANDIYHTYRHQIQQGLNRYYGSRIGLIAPNGIWDRKSQKNLIKAIQLEWGVTVDGSFGSGTLSMAPILSRNTSGYTNSKRLLQWCLTINGFYPGSFDGQFRSNTYKSLYNFQEFVCLCADGICDKQSWASLMISSGASDRIATTLLTNKEISFENAAIMVTAGYKDVGRYLTNTPDETLDKAMTPSEIEIIRSVGLNIFPIFKTDGDHVSYFTGYQGIIDAKAAKNAAYELGFPPSATIYFCVNYDAFLSDIESNIIPYFKNIKEQIGNSFKIGAYGPRYICTKLSDMGLSSSSFISDITEGFSCNIGQTLPSNWAYDKFTKVPLSESEFIDLDYDKCIASTRRTATSPNEFVVYEYENFPVVSLENLRVFEQLYNLAYEYLESSSDPFTGIYPTVLGANQIVLAYLRHKDYNGTAWATLAGPIEESYNKKVLEQYPEINLENIFLTDPVSGKQIEIQHFAATLGSLITYVSVIDSYLDPLADAFAGWAGDLMQVGGVIGTSIQFGGTDYFLHPGTLYKIIGALEGELNDCKFYYKNIKTEEIEYKTTGGFDYVDLVQDIDAFNISKLYSLNSMPIHLVLDAYYNIDQYAEKRYSIFESKLLLEFATSSVFETAKKFTCLEGVTVKVMNRFFANRFGSFNNSEYGEVLATAFSDKISYYKSQESMNW